jgi:hypothetical protein
LTLKTVGTVCNVLLQEMVRGDTSTNIDEYSTNIDEYSTNIDEYSSHKLTLMTMMYRVIPQPLIADRLKLDNF